MHNVSFVVKKDLCLGCGVCQDICPKKCIDIRHGIVNYPEVDDAFCTSCGKCLKVCPGRGVSLNEMAFSLYGNTKGLYNKYVGYYDKCFATYSTDHEIRFHSASGGTVSQFLIFLLEKGIVDGAVVVGFHKASPMRPYVYIAKTRQEILDGKSSKYCVVSYDGIISEIEQCAGNYVVVGLPCHIQGIRKVACLSKKVSERVIGYFSIYCSSSKNMLSQEYFIYRYKVNKRRIARFSYRDYGCMGSMVFEDSFGRSLAKKIPYLSYNLGVKGFFTPWRCLLCIDHFGELADVCFGDIQIGEYKNDPIGVNSVISRSPYWTDLLIAACNNGHLHLSEVNVETIVESQKFCKIQKKGPGVVAEFNLRRVMGKAVPEYDQPFCCHQSNMKSYAKSVIRMTMRYIGRHRSIWWIIKMLDKDKKSYTVDV